MGTDINGNIEVRRGNGTWEAVVTELSPLIGRSYDLFGCLFGVRNYANFAPLFAERGLPNDSPLALDLELRKHMESPSWCTFRELDAVDPDEPALAPDQRIHEFRVEDDGSEVLVTKAVWSGPIAHRYDEIRAKGQVRDGRAVYRSVTMTRRDALKPLQPVMTQMAAQALLAGRDHVRLVVYFGS